MSDVVIATAQYIEIADARADERFAHAPAVKGPPYMRFYAGVPLVVHGVAVGAFCVVDVVPRQIDETERVALRALAAGVCELLETRARLDRDAQNELVVLSTALNALPFPLRIRDTSGRVVFRNLEARRAPTDAPYDAHVVFDAAGGRFVTEVQRIRPER